MESRTKAFGVLIAISPFAGQREMKGPGLTIENITLALKGAVGGND
jgi:hypothetical protein